jgi:hypothetical protein
MVTTKPLEDVVLSPSGPGALRGELRIEPSPRWVRAYVNGVAIADSKHVLTATIGLPIYYFPVRDVRRICSSRLVERRRIRSWASDRSLIFASATAGSKTPDGG